MCLGAKRGGLRPLLDYIGSSIVRVRVEEIVEVFPP